MNTGTPLDLTPFGAVLTGIGFLYWALALAVAGLGIWFFKRWWLKLLISGAVLAAFVYPVATHVREQKHQQQEAKARFDAAMARFDMRCKGAGEKISRVVENVEGVVWMKWRDTDVNNSDQFKLDDPYGRDCGGEDCIGKLLRVSKGAELNPEGVKLHTKGFGYVETPDPGGQLYRYVGVMKLRPIWTEEAIAREKALTGKGIEPSDHVFAWERESIPKLTARYGVTWDDISTREDREQWIAGGSLKVLDLQTNEVIAERIGYMVDRGLGSQAGFRSPWGFAQQTACPLFPTIGDFDPRRTRSGAETRDFVFKVLQPKQGK